MNTKHEIQNDANWREAALREVLQTRGSLTVALMRQIRAQLPDAAILVLSPERRQLEKFLREQCGAQSLVAGSSRYEDNDSDESWTYLDWQRARWQNEFIEVVILPGDFAYDEIVCIAQSAGVLQSFSQSLLDFTQKPQGRALRYAQGWESAPDLDSEIGKVTWDDIVLAPEIMRGLREAIEGFFAHRDAYAALGFAWRRGVLLVGPPGTGKTMVCKAAAATLPDLPFLYVRDLREIPGHEAIKAIFRRARKLAPCVLAFEDIDGLVADGNRTVFLNEMDGFGSNDGLLIIASSNHPGKIDEALLKRPSRFDRVFHIGLPEESERAEYSRRLLHRSSLAQKLAPQLDREKLSLEVASQTDGFTPAYLKEAFTAAALQRAQNGAMILDEEFGRAVLEQVEELKAHLKRAKNPDAMGEMKSRDDAIGFRR